MDGSAGRGCSLEGLGDRESYLDLLSVDGGERSLGEADFRGGGDRLRLRNLPFPGDRPPPYRLGGDLDLSWRQRLLAELLAHCTHFARLVSVVKCHTKINYHVRVYSTGT